MWSTVMLATEDAAAIRALAGLQSPLVVVPLAGNLKELLLQAGVDGRSPK